MEMFDMLEEQRKETRKWYIIHLLINILLVASLVLVFLWIYSVILTIVVFILSIICWHKKSKKRYEYKKQFENYFIRNEMEKVFDRLMYVSERGIDEDTIRNTKMIWLCDRFFSFNYMSGYYKNRYFYQADVIVEENRETDDRSNYVEVLNAKWMVFEFNKPFNSNVHISEKKFKNRRMGGAFSFDNFKLVKLESYKFNKKFQVYCEEEKDAFYILTPHLMEKFLRLEKSINGKFLFGIVGNQLHICFYPKKKRKDYFTIYRKIKKTKIANQISDAIKLIVSIVEELDLDDISN